MNQTKTIIIIQGISGCVAVIYILQSKTQKAEQEEHLRQTCWKGRLQKHAYDQ